MSSRVVSRFEYRYERYRESYFSQTRLNTYMGTVEAATSSSTFLGATQPVYDAHLVSVLIGYRF
ncbi:MAG: MtrB/PioB family outer membrane beta-barrel protein [candidate division Zixibacteria bacterium]|nr:MtrB/PioB family outer membrane beta-barrel protein [candidate division Zixibacteria bacterium]